MIFNMIFKRVYSITPNPSLDLNGKAEKITPNEKNYIRDEARFPGGNAINAARILSRLNHSVSISGFVGGATGDQVKKLLDIEKMHTDFVRIKNDTRINVTVSNLATHKQTRFSFPGPKIQASEKILLAKNASNKKQGNLFILGGSFPPNFLVKDAKAILKKAHQNKIATIIDVPSTLLKTILHSRPLMIKPNLSEFEEFIEKKPRDLGQIICEARKLLNFCPIICISSVNKGVLLVTENANYLAQGPQITAKSSVGAGDSLVGGMTAGMLNEGFSYEMFFDSQGRTTPQKIKHDSWHAILRLGMGAALATICQRGTELGSKTSISKYAKKIRIKEV